MSRFDPDTYCRDCDRSIYGKYHDCDVNIENDGKYVMSDEKCYCKITNGKKVKRMTREEAINILWMYDVSFEPHPAEEVMHAIDMAIEALRQPERTCVNCGRTANNGGWYADGRTRCPIEEHYALPKDGYCHLWEKRNVTDDDYPERFAVRCNGISGNEVEYAPD